MPADAVTAPYDLSVVIPTRNRPGALRSLLVSLRQQTLPPSQFEVVIVDDGSDVALNQAQLAAEMPFSLRVLRRTSDHGPHASRWASLKAARGRRVLFLDDDTEPEPRLLAAHGALGARGFALGPILYPASACSTPYRRYMARFYASYVQSLFRRRTLDVGEFYICNSSAPTGLWDQVLSAAHDVHGHAIFVPELDEHLIGRELARRAIAPEFIPDALLWHHDRKTFPQAWAERCRAGAALCKVLLTQGSLNQGSPLYSRFVSDAPSQRLRRLVLFAYWRRPAAVPALAKKIAAVLELAPASWVPLWACGALLRVAHWEGVRATTPSIQRLQATLRAPASECEFS